MKTDTTETFAENLRLLCSYTDSVSSVCRRLSINRQQFARYLNGDNFPSSRNVRKICDFFGVEEHEIHLPAVQFRELIVVRPKEQLRAPRTVIERIDFKGDGDLAASRKYIGYYHRYLQSVEYPGKIIKALVRIEEAHGQLVLKAIERLKPFNQKAKSFDIYKYQGKMFLLADRIFILENDYILNNSITETILYPSHKNPMHLLFGRALGVSSGASREPYMTPMVYEFLGSRIEGSAAMRGCGLLPEGDPSIDERIQRHLAPGPI